MSRMPMLLVRHPHSAQKSPPDPKLWFHCSLAIAISSDSNDCNILSPDNNQADSSKSVVLQQGWRWPPTETGNGQRHIWLPSCTGEGTAGTYDKGQGAANILQFIHQLTPWGMIWAHTPSVRRWGKYEARSINSPQDYINPRFGSASSIQHCSFTG